MKKLCAAFGFISISSVIFAAGPARPGDAPPPDGAWDAIERAGLLQMAGKPEEALEACRQALGGLAARTAADRAALQPEIEYLLRRTYALAGELSRYAQALPAFEPWLASAEVLPAAGALARYYAGACAAYSTGDLDQAGRLWEPLGFLSSWWVIGPFDNERGGGFMTAYGPEKDRRPSQEISHPGKNRAVSWRPLPVRPITGWVDLDALLRPNDQAVAYAMTFIESAAPFEAALRLGSDEGYRLWINGRLAASRDLHRRMRFDQDAVPIRLQRGWNSILFKVAEAQGSWEFRARLTALDGAPLEGWKEGFPPEGTALPAAAGAEENSGEAPPPPRPGPTEQLRERLAGQETAAGYFLLGALLSDRRAHDVTEHPDEEALRQAIALHPGPVPAFFHYQLARASRREAELTAERDDNAWREALERAARSEPPAVAALVDLARYYLDTFENLRRAEELVREALARHPGHAGARLLLGEIEERRGFPAARERAYRACLAAGAAADPEIQRHRAQTLRRAGSGAESEALLRGLYAENRSDRQTFEALAQLLLDQGRAGEAVAIHEEQIRLRPFDLSARQKLVRLWRGQEENERALAAAQEMAAIAPGDHDLRKLEGDLLGRLGRQAEALASYEKALEIQPNFPEVREYIDFLRSRKDPFVEEFRRDLGPLLKAPPQPATTAAPGSPDDPAEVLLDLTAVQVNPDGTAKEFRQVLLRILNDSGVRQFDRYRTHYAAGDQRVEFKAARVIHPDGREDRPRLQVFSGGEEGSGTFRSASIDLPPLDQGDRVEVQYVIEDLRQSFFGDYFGRRESFIDALPMREKTFILRVPAGREFHFHQRRLDLTPQVDRDANRGVITYTWTARDVAKLKPEPEMPPRSEIDPQLEISTFKSWKDFSSWYWNLIRQQFETSPEISGKARELTSGASTDLERIRALYRFVSQEIRYNAWPFGVHGFKPYNAAAIFSRRFGDCKDKATLLTTLLKEAGIPSYPVLIYATEERGEEDHTLPVIQHFNHCITYIPPGAGREELFLDGTALHHGLKELPGMDRGAKVLVVKPGGELLTQVPWNRPEELAAEESVQAALNPDGSAILEVRVLARGDHAGSLRSYFEVAGKRRENLENIYGSRFAGAKLEEEEFSDLGDPEAPVNFRVKLRVPQLAAPAPEGLAVKALEDFFQTSRALSGLGSLESRRQDLLLGNPSRSRLVASIQLPEALRVKSLPAARSFQDRFGRLETAYREENGRVIFERLIETTANRVAREEYPRFRELAAAIEALKDEKIILAARAAGANPPDGEKSK